MGKTVINVEVAYASEERQLIISIKVPENTTVEQAIEISKICETFPEIDLQKNKVGIFSRIVSLGEKLTEGDRIQIFRPLKIDPKKARKDRI